MSKEFETDNVRDFCQALLDRRVDRFLEYEEQTDEARHAYEAAIERALRVAHKAGIEHPNLVTCAVRAYANFRVKDDPRNQKRDYSRLKSDLVIIEMVEKELAYQRKQAKRALEELEEKAPTFSPDPLHSQKHAPKS